MSKRFGGEDPDTYLPGPAMSTLSREQIHVELYGGEDYRVYDGARLVATVYAEADVKWLLDRDAAQRALLRQREEEIERTKKLLQRRSRIGDEDRALALDLRAQLAAMVEQRAQDGLDGQSALDMLNNQLAARERAVWLEAANTAHEWLEMAKADMQNHPDIEELLHGRCQAHANFEDWLRQQAEAVKPLPAPEEG